MAEFMMANLNAVRFTYGLIFFSLGFAIGLQPRRGSVYYLASALSWLGAFALFHAFADWGLVFLPSPETGAPETIEAVHQIRSLGVIISFGFLLQFGLALLTEHSPWRRLVPLVPLGIVSAFFFLRLMESLDPGAMPAWLLDSKVTSRYFLGLPAAMLSAWGLLTQVQALRRDNLGRHVGHLYGAAACFVLYGIVGGLVVPERDYFPANLVSEERFFAVMHVPVEVARALAFLGITVFTVKLLEIFNLETQRRLQAAERDRALLREREQIARELHDGIMQTLYGTGLGLKQVMLMPCTQDGQANEILSALNKEIGRSIVQMRTFVLDLKEAVITGQELALAVQTLAGEMGQFAGIRVHITTECPEDLKVPGGIREEVLAVVREGLSNVVRHAGTAEARVVLSVEDGVALVRISDDGEGFDPAAAGTRSLDTLRDRIEALGGFMQVLSEMGQGTQLVAHLPVRSERLAAQKGA